MLFSSLLYLLLIKTRVELDPFGRPSDRTKLRNDLLLSLVVSRYRADLVSHLLTYLIVLSMARLRLAR